ncbi:MAG: crossover junction endodeoxyribonuclease RuvC [Chloroherpetonaceae bacterium]|nr:crossover junction endodeoxyribonuclease RuvC [Chloroherpetonaceae bacterium]MDW8467313.1 crossover junction endodeoxyribonuclease RuvC [Chloroherpetonaceae bacterium]
MRIIGIDPGSLTTGYGIIDAASQAVAAVDFGVVCTHAKEEMALRLKHIYDRLSQLLQQYRPTRLALETAFYGKNAQSALKLGQVRGVVLLLAVSYGLEITEYSPREVKQALTGNGNAAKEQVAFMVRKFLCLSDTGPFLDASDALGIALCDALRHNSPQAVTKRTLQRKSQSWKRFLEAHPHLIIQS